jgi:transposase InsO family protein
MGVNRSGYYKWIDRKGKENRYEQNRVILTGLLKKEHSKHKSFGYHRLASEIRKHNDWGYSDNLVHKCCKEEHICSKAKKYHYRKPGDESIIYPNTVSGNWNATRPLELVVSDMTCIRNNGKLYEWTLFIDTFNNEIIAHASSAQRGDPVPYYICLNRLKRKVGKKKEQTAPVVLHTDQGAVYSSRAYEQAHKDYNIIRSMSRAGTPTDNPIIESLNGWIKAELDLDFDVRHSKNLYSLLNRYVNYFNHTRLAAALGYKSPIQYKTDSGF